MVQQLVSQIFFILMQSLHNCLVLFCSASEIIGLLFSTYFTHCCLVILYGFSSVLQCCRLDVEEWVSPVKIALQQLSAGSGIKVLMTQPNLW